MRMRRRVGVVSLVLCIVCTSFFGKDTGSYAAAKETTSSIHATGSVKKSQLNYVGYSEAERHAAELMLATWEMLGTKCDLTKFHIRYDDFWELFYQLKDANHRNFFIESADVDSVWESKKDDFFVTTVKFRYKYSKEIIREMLHQYDNAIATAVEMVCPNWSELEKALYLNDYLAANATYDTSYSKYAAYNALVEKTAVCQGYSEAYQALMDTVGILCNIVGSASLNHAWNMIQIDGKSYYVDVTWNDPLGNWRGRSGHRFFLKSKQFMCSEEGGHFVLDDWNNGDSYEMPEASSLLYDDCFWNDMDTCFFPIGDAWYAFDGNTSINKYEYKDGVFEKTDTLANIYDTWYVVGMPGWYWN